MAESGASSPEVVRSEFLDASLFRVLPDNVPDDLLAQPASPQVPARVARLKILPFEISAECSQSSTTSFTQCGTGIVRM